MKKIFLSLLSLLPLIPLTSCMQYGQADQSGQLLSVIPLKYIKKDPTYKENNLNKYFKNTYLDKDFYIGDISKWFKDSIKNSRALFNETPTLNLEGFTSEFDNELKSSYAITEQISLPITIKDIQEPAKLFDIKENNFQYLVNFINNFYQGNNSNIIGYKFFNGISNNSKTIIRAIGGPINRVNNLSGSNIYFKLKSDYDVITLNDSQYSFDPIKLDQQINKTKTGIGYLEAFENLFKVQKNSIDTYTMIKLINFVLSYIDAQRIEQLQDYLTKNNQTSYLYGFSQGYTTLQMAMLMDPDILSKAQKIRTDNNSIRPLVGLFKNGSNINYNIRNSGAVLTSTTESDAISGSRMKISALFAYSKRLISLTENLIGIYQKVFQEKPLFKNEYKKKVRVSFSNADWNIGDITPLEINFFEKNATIKASPYKGHGFNFPSSDYVDWIKN